MSISSLGEMGLKTVGELPQGLPVIRPPSQRLRDVDGVIPLAFACFLLSYIESVSAARTLAASAAWRDRFPKEGVREWHVHDAASYYDILSTHASRIDLWETEYIHVLPNVEAIVEWYKGTGLRPYLDPLPDPDDQQRFAAEYLEMVPLP